MKTRFALPAAALLTLLAGAALAEEAATVKSNRLNVRGQPSLKSEVVTQLREGETVTVLEEIKVEKPGPGEPAAWAKIALPANTPVWVYSELIKDNAVTGSRLNVRSGPGEHYSVLGRLDKGTTVQEIRKVDEWMEIVAPAGAYAFVAADHLSKTAPLPPPPAPAPDKNPAMLAEAKPVRPPEPLPTVVVPDAALQPPPVPKPVTEPVATPPPPVPAPAVPAPAVPARPVEALPPTLQPAPVPVRPASPEVAVIEEADAPPRVIVREGVVRRAISVQAPSAFRLAHEDTGNTINYLYPGKTGLELKYFLGQKLRVSGVEAIDSRWPNTPLLEIKTLEPLR